MTLPRFYPILDTGACARAGIPVRAAAAAILGSGAQILQLRHKGHFNRDLFESAEAISGWCRQAGAMFIVNDRADVAALLGAGVHLGQEDLPVAETRKLLPQGIIGFSTHNEVQLLASRELGADYVALGPIFGTASKENPDPVVGVAELRRLRPLTDKPLVAIGGITRFNAAEIFASGADSVAIIGDVYEQVHTAADLEVRCREWLAL